MSSITRREMLKTMAVALAGKSAFGPATMVFGSSNIKKPETTKIPLLHITDLYQPPQDPDDQVDLATVFALNEFDLKGIVLDITHKFLVSAPQGFDIPRDPGFVPVAQLNYLTGRSIPVAMGPTQPLKMPDDKALHRPLQEQAGIELILQILEQSDEPVVITMGGSARAMAVAFNRNQELVKSKTRAIVLNAGWTAGTKREWNVMLDTAAYIRLWQSGLPIHWFPPATQHSAFDAANDRGTYWKVSHKTLFRNIPDELRGWFAYGFSGSQRGDIIRALSEEGSGSVWAMILEGQRNMWSTVSLIMTAGRALTKTSHGWRFLPKNEVNALETWPLRLDPIKATANANGMIEWKITDKKTNHYLFGRKGGVEYGMAMAEALNALLQNMRI